MTEKERKKQIAAAKKGVDLLNKKFGGAVKLARDSKQRGGVERFPTGCFTLDIITGGGFPKGRVTEFHGIESSGKTTAALKAVAANQGIGNRCLYIECEGNWDPGYAKLLGVDLDTLSLVEEENEQETIIDIIEISISSKLYEIIILDSIAAPLPRAVRDKSASQPTMGLEARLNNLLMRKAVAAMKEGDKPWCSLVIINQVRDVLGSYVPLPPRPGGGRGIKFFKAVAVEFRLGARRGEHGEIVKMAGKPILGQTIDLRVPKNKTFRPKLTGSVDYYWADAPELELKAYEYDHVKEVVTLAMGTPGIVKQSGGWYYLYEGWPDYVGSVPEKVHGVGEFVNVVREHPNYQEELKSRLLKVLGSDASTIMVE